MIRMQWITWENRQKMSRYAIYGKFIMDKSHKIDNWYVLYFVIVYFDFVYTKHYNYFTPLLIKLDRKKLNNDCAKSENLSEARVWISKRSFSPGKTNWGFGFLRKATKVFLCKMCLSHHIWFSFHIQKLS